MTKQGTGGTDAEQSSDRYLSDLTPGMVVSTTAEQKQAAGPITIFCAGVLFSVLTFLVKCLRS